MKTSELKPIKRHEGIVKFSREHHFGLLLVWKIRQGIKNNIEPERIGKYVKFFFENDLQQHFKEEETSLFTKLKADDPMLGRTVQEHIEIYALMNEINAGNNNYELLKKFGNTLEDHIRFEERILFNYIQEQLSENELLQLSENHQERTGDTDDNWKDQFWVMKKPV